MIEDEEVISTNDIVLKVQTRYVRYSELSHAAKAFEECNPAYGPKYNGYYRFSHSSEEEAPVMLLTNDIKPADKINTGDKNCIRFRSKQFHGIIEKLQFSRCAATINL